MALDVAILEHLFNYEDDFLILAKSKAELGSRIEALTDAVGNLPGGQFELSVKTVSHASEGLDFLGHRLFSRNGQAQAEPSVGNTMRLAKRLHEIDEKHRAFSNLSGKIGKSALLHSSADKFAVISGWKAAFASCHPETEGWQYLLAIEEGVHADLKAHGLCPSDLPAAAEPLKRQNRKFYFYKWFA